jgi:hypothetical protein
MGQNCEQNGHTSACVQLIGLAVACIAARGMTDGDGPPRAQQMADRILEFACESGIGRSFDEGEKSMLARPAGAWSQMERNQASWLFEGLSVLAWAVKQSQLPAFETKCHATQVGLALGLFKPGTAEQMGLWPMRSLEEITPWAAHYFALNWRLHHYFVKPEKIDFEVVLRDQNWPPSVRKSLDLIDGDLILDGRALPEVGEARLSEVFGIVRERCKAFRWLTGYDASYATVAPVQ